MNNTTVTFYSKGQPVRTLREFNPVNVPADAVEAAAWVKGHQQTAQECGADSWTASLDPEGDAINTTEQEG